MDDDEVITQNIYRLLREHVHEGDEAEVAINNDLEAVIIFINGEARVVCSFDDLLAYPGAALN